MSEQPKQKKQKSPAPIATTPGQWEIHEAKAIQALSGGIATPEQQKVALDWIVNCAADTYNLSYRPGVGGDRDTAFAEGRRFVGLQIAKLVKLNLSIFKERK